MVASLRYHLNTARVETRSSVVGARKIKAFRFMPRLSILSKRALSKRSPGFTQAKSSVARITMIPTVVIEPKKPGQVMIVCSIMLCDPGKSVDLDPPGKVRSAEIKRPSGEDRLAALWNNNLRVSSEVVQ